MIAFNKMSLEVSERIKLLDKEFLTASEKAEADLNSLSAAERKQMQKDFLGDANESKGGHGGRATIPPESAISIAYGDESGEMLDETLDEVPVIDFE